VTLTLPYPPSVNHLHTVARGRKIKSLRARQYANEVHYRVMDELRVEADAWLPCKNDRLYIIITAHAPDKRKRDLDNLLKGCLDSVCAALGVDDSQIDQLTICRGYVDRANPHVRVRLGLMPTEAIA
jgi:crossover junction endodeoxyribonuclease RusA